MLEKPGFRAIKQDIFKRIRDGEWRPGAMLPGEVELAAEFGCARATVNRAMQELSDDGIIERRRKGGSRVKLTPVQQVVFAIPLVRAEIEASGASYQYRLISDVIAAAPRHLQLRMGLRKPCTARHIKCLHMSGHKPYQFEDRWINLSTISSAATADFSMLSPNEWLVQEVPYTNAEVRFCASPAKAGIARLLRARIGDPILISERTTWLATEPITYVRLHFAPGHQMIATYRD